MIAQSHLNVLKDFAPISLEQLNATMSLMERVDKKYVVPLTELGRIMKQLQQDYFVLSINDNSLFTYDNIYMDTEDALFHQQHEQGEKSRMKVRTRHYLESKLAFFECKQKKGSLTRKGRYRIQPQQSLSMSDQSQSFFHGVCASLELPFAEAKLQPMMRTLYQRITLCSKKNDERITIDFDIKFQDRTKPLAPVVTLPPIAIIESKSTHNKCRSHETLRELGYRPVSGCSKYCLAMLYTGYIKETKTFAKTIKLIDSFNKPKRTLVKKTTKKLTAVKKTVTQPKTVINTAVQTKKKINS